MGVYEDPIEELAKEVVDDFVGEQALDGVLTAIDLDVLEKLVKKALEAAVVRGEKNVFEAPTRLKELRNEGRFSS